MARAYDFSISHTSRHNNVPSHFQHSSQDYISIELCWCCVEFGRGDSCATLLGNQTPLLWWDWFIDLNPLSVALDGRRLPSHQSPTFGVMHSCYWVFLFYFILFYFIFFNFFNFIYLFIYFLKVFNSHHYQKKFSLCVLCIQTYSVTCLNTYLINVTVTYV